jgi:hypothetical protein
MNDLERVRRVLTTVQYLERIAQEIAKRLPVA